MRFDSEMIIAIVIIGIPFLIVLFRIFYTKMNGIEADAVVTRYDDDYTMDADGDLIPSTHVYVRYRTQEGRLVEGELANPKNSLGIGDFVTVRYLPGREENPVLV